MPLYQQLKQRLRTEIARGEYKPGDQLPAEPELIQQFGVSRITVRQALSDLAAEGLVVRRHGKGTFVAERRIQHDLVRLTDFVEDMELAGVAPSSRVIAFAHEPASAAVASALMLQAEAEVVRVDRLRLANGEPIACDTAWLPLRYGALLSESDLAAETIIHVLEVRFTIPIERGVFYFTAAAASEMCAQALQVAPGSPLLVIERVSFTHNEEPVYLQRRYYRPDRVQYRVTVQRRADGNGDQTALSELRPIFVGETGDAGH
jgi:GntR family transcriptional regulator